MCRNQQYDVTGVSGSTYSLLSDYSFFVNARFATAYTTGLHVDPTTLQAMPMRPKGTWIDQVGVVMTASSLPLDHAVSLVVTAGVPNLPAEESLVADSGVRKTRTNPPPPPPPFVAHSYALSLLVVGVSSMSTIEVTHSIYAKTVLPKTQSSLELAGRTQCRWALLNLTVAR